MANNPQKSSDTAKDPLATFEDALRGGERAVPLDVQRAQRGSEDLFQGDAAAAPWTEDGVRRAANDDRAAVGAILQTLQRKPSRTPYLVATALSALWLLGAGAFALAFRVKLATLFAQPDVAGPVMVAIATAVLVPVAVCYALAHAVRRTNDLRLVSQTMAEVAMKLAEPETAARESIVNVGQAIRREVAAMADGIERALARAAELEALVHNEVSALERAYNDNEVRIRDLLTELTNQRETLVNQAEHVQIGRAHV